MVNLSKKMLAVASAALAFAGIASAASTCVLGTNVNIIRSEGTAELLAPLTVTCTADGAGSTLASGTLNLTFSNSLPINGKVLDASTGKTEVTAVVGGITYFGTVSGSNVNFSALTLPAVGAGGVFTVVVNNVRVNANSLQLASGAAPIVTVSGYIASSALTAVPLTAFNAAQVAYIQSGFAAPGFYNAYSTGAAGFTNGGVPVGTTASTKNGYNTCTNYSPVGDAKDLSVVNAAGGSLAFAVRVGENFTTSFKNAAGEASSTAVAVGAVNNTVANGTRVQVSFASLPSGVSVYVPTSVINSGAAGSVASIQLTSTAAGTAHAPVTPTVSSDLSATGPVVGSTTLALVNGTAVFEVLTSDPALDYFDIPVFVVVKANTVAVASSISATVSLSPSGSSVIPNFAAGSATVGGSTFTACSTSLLFPFVSSQLGFDTGLAIANTSSDPLGTTNGSKSAQAGTCAISFYGDGAPAASVTTESVASGKVYTKLLSDIAPGFQGYAIARCNFQYAHGYAYLNYGFGTSSGVSTGYLANVIAATRSAVLPETQGQ
jgi:hypothetical protein